jgi:N-acyl-phosphatidylethanolamine-hydrolysing phospholipase D
MLRVENGRFRNLHPHPVHGWRELLRWQLGFGPPERAIVDRTIVPRYQPDVAAVNLGRIGRPPKDGLQITWIGHATFLVQVAGCNILTDPVFGRCCGPFPSWRLRRRAPLPVRLDQLPPIHAVLLSHNHYDHLEWRTARRLGREPTWFVPLGNRAWFEARGLDNLVEMDWWHEADLGPLSVVCVPAQHFSARSPFDRNLTLWCGWVLRTPLGHVYFAGDSGYNPSFGDIGAHLGPMRLALLPIGAYQPRWFMAPMHLSPEEAVRAHLDVRSAFSVAMHWGTFALADEPLAEPPIALRQALARRHIPATQFTTMRIGETTALDGR